MKALLLFLLTTASLAADPRFGTRDFVEFQPGELPLVLTAPHGGRQKPADLPDRRDGVLTMDANTQELARAVANAIAAHTGARPHLVICHLHRSKLDANRELSEAAQNNPAASQAWQEYHAFIEQACHTAVNRHGWAFLLDLHGHGHPVAQIELGWLHQAADLAQPKSVLNTPAFAARGSAELLARRSTLPYSEFLSGPTSLGARLEEQGFPTTPSPRLPVPTLPYFRGGYTVARHCHADHGVAGVQIEAPRPRLRDTETNRQRFAEALATALDRFLPNSLTPASSKPATRQK